MHLHSPSSFYLLILLSPIISGCLPFVSQANMASSIENVDEKNIEKGLVSLTPSQNLISEPLPSSTFGKQVGYKKFVISRHNDTELHLAAGRGDLAAVKQILDDIHSRIFGTVSGVEFDMRVAEIRASMVNKVNELGETVLFTAADHGHLI